MKWLMGIEKYIILKHKISLFENFLSFLKPKSHKSYPLKMNLPQITSQKIVKHEQ